MENNERDLDLQNARKASEDDDMDADAFIEELRAESDSELLGNEEQDLPTVTLDESEAQEISPLWAAVLLDRKDVLVKALEDSLVPNVEELSPDGITPLAHACHHGQTEIVQLLLDAGADINLRSLHGMTPIMWALTSKDQPLIDLLMARKPYLGGTDDNGRSTVEWATRYDNFDTAREIARRLHLIA
jgi:ankyrin repeat protein